MKSRREERIEKQKKSTRKWIATGAAAVLLLTSGAIAYQNFAGKPNQETSGQAVPSSCSTTRSVTVATTESMAKVIEAIPVDAQSCIAFETVTNKSASDVVEESQTDSAATNLWIPDSSLRAELAMTEKSTGLKQVSESLAQSLGVLVSNSSGSSDNWYQALENTSVAMSDPKTDSAAFSALMASVAEVSQGTVSMEDLGQSAGKRAQTIGVESPVQSPQQLLDAADRGDAPSAIVTEADYLAYQASHSNSKLTASLPNTGSFTLDYPLYQIASSRNSTVESAAEQITAFMASDQGKQALKEAGLRTASGEIDNTSSLGSYTALAPSDSDLLSRLWTAYSRQSAPFNALVVIDASGSMLTPVTGTDKTRMDVTVESVLAGSQLFAARDSMGLWKFSRNLTTASGEVSDYEELVPLRGFEEVVDGKTQRQILQEAGTGIATSIQHNHETALYDSILASFLSVKRQYADGAVNGVLVLTDGQNVDEDSVTLEELITTLQSEQDPERPIALILIGISEDTDMNALNTIAQSVGGEAFVAASPADIQQIFAQALTGAQQEQTAAPAGQ